MTTEELQDKLLEILRESIILYLTECHKQNLIPNRQFIIDLAQSLDISRDTACTMYHLISLTITK